LDLLLFRSYFEAFFSCLCPPYVVDYRWGISANFVSFSNLTQEMHSHEPSTSNEWSSWRGGFTFFNVITCLAFFLNRPIFLEKTAVCGRFFFPPPCRLRNPPGHDAWPLLSLTFQTLFPHEFTGDARTNLRVWRTLAPPLRSSTSTVLFSLTPLLIVFCLAFDRFFWRRGYQGTSPFPCDHTPAP